MLASQTEIDLGKAKVIGYVNDALNGGLAYRATNFVIVGRGGNNREARGAICHSVIGAPGVSPLCVTTELGVRRRHAFRDTPKGLLDTFVQFLRTDPLWAPYVVDTFEDGITIDASAPQNVLQALMISSRLCWEASDDAFYMFNDALSKGLHSRIAFLYGFASTASSYKYDSTERSAKTTAMENAPVVSKIAHRPWALLGGKSLDAYLNGKFTPTRPYAVYQTTGHVMNMFGSEGLIDYLFTLDSFKDRLRDFRAGSKEALYAPPNPFAPKPRVQVLHQGQVSLTEYRTVVLDELVSLYNGQGGLANVA